MCFEHEKEDLHSPFIRDTCAHDCCCRAGSCVRAGCSRHGDTAREFRRFRFLKGMSVTVWASIAISPQMRPRRRAFRISWCFPPALRRFDVCIALIKSLPKRRDRATVFVQVISAYGHGDVSMWVLRLIFVACRPPLSSARMIQAAEPAPIGLIMLLSVSSGL